VGRQSDSDTAHPIPTGRCRDRHLFRRIALKNQTITDLVGDLNGSSRPTARSTVESKPPRRRCAEARGDRSSAASCFVTTEDRPRFASSAPESTTSIASRAAVVVKAGKSVPTIVGSSRRRQLRHRLDAPVPSAVTVTCTGRHGVALARTEPCSTSSRRPEVDRHALGWTDQGRLPPRQAAVHACGCSPNTALRSRPNQRWQLACCRRSPRTRPIW